ncbi:MAG: type II toxin-antitoxin system VapC family toxin [Desulfatitalea sp.]|nr:type II toxin-antitoxin system VapC family toxin [Desulfatitalea sp.]
MRYLLDTNICIYLIKTRPASVMDRFRQHSPEDVAVSTITLFELAYGAKKSQNAKRSEDALAKLVMTLDLVELDRFAAEEAAKIRTRLEKAGTPIGPYDLLIAGIARARQMVLVTNNTREFERIDGLRIENWVG